MLWLIIIREDIHFNLEISLFFSSIDPGSTEQEVFGSRQIPLQVENVSVVHEDVAAPVKDVRNGICVALRLYAGGVVAL